MNLKPNAESKKSPTEVELRKSTAYSLIVISTAFIRISVCNLSKNTIWIIKTEQCFHSRQQYHLHFLPSVIISHIMIY